MRRPIIASAIAWRLLKTIDQINKESLEASGPSSMKLTDKTTKEHKLVNLNNAIKNS